MADAVIGSLVFEMRANAARLNTDLGKVTSDFRKLEREVKGIGRNLGLVFKTAFAVTGALAIKTMTAELVNLAKRGEVAGSIAENFEKLGGDSGAIGRAKEQTLGMVSAFDLMAIASKAILKGVPEVNANFELLAKYGAQLADTFGGDTKASIEAVTEALARVNEKSLLAIGISIDTDKAYQKYAATLGIVKEAGQRWQDVLTDQQQKLAKQAEVIDAINERSAKLAPVTMSVANAQEAFTVALKDAGDSLGIGINNSEGLSQAYQTLTQTINELDWKRLGEDIAEFAKTAANLANVILPNLANILDVVTGGRKTQGAALSKEVNDLVSQLERAKKVADDLAASGRYPNLLPGAVAEVAKLEEKVALARSNWQDFLKLLDSPTAGTKGPAAIGKEVGGISKAAKDAEKLAKKQWADRVKAADDYYRHDAELAIKAEEERGDRMLESAEQFNSAVTDAINGDFAGSFKNLASAFSEDINGALGSAASQEAFAQVGAGIGNIISLTMAKNISGTNSKGGGIFGAAIGAAIGASVPGGGAVGFLIGSQVGGQLGGLIGEAWKTGLQNAESQARVDVEGWLEDVLGGLGNVRFFNKDGALGGLFSGNIIGKAFTSTFNKPDWVDNMDSWGEKAKGVFLGLGEAIKEVRGITEDVGDQIGFILGTNLSGNIDNARLLVQQLGLSFEDMSKALLESALKGQITWLQFNSYIRDTGEAFKPGLEATGAIQQAFQNLIDSAGQGREAVKSFKDVAVEAMEAGVTSLDELKAQLLEKGFDPQYVEALFAGAAARELKTLQEWAASSDSTAGSVVGDMEAASAKLKTQWEDLRTSLQQMRADLEAIPKEIQSKIKLSVTTNMDDNTQQLMASLPGVLPGGIPQSGALAPQTAAYKFGGTSSAALKIGASGGGGGTVINVDARNATPGVEAQIMRAAAHVEQKVMNSVMAQLQNDRSRGGRRGDSY